MIGAVELPRLGGSLTWSAALFRPAPGYLDFDHAYYPAAEHVRRDAAQLYRGATYDRRTGELAVSAPAYFVNVPLMAWIFVPFTLLPLRQAGAIFLALNTALALAALLLLQRRAAGSGELWRWGITAVFVTSGPLLNALNLGQTTPLILLLLLAAEGSLRKGHQGLAGCWLGLACLMKMPPLLFLLYLALRRHWRTVAAAGAVMLLAGGISIACYGWPLHVTYFDVAIRAHTGTALAAHNSQSIDSFLARLMTDASIWSWHPQRLSHGATAMKWAMVVALLGVGGWVLGPARAPAAHRHLVFEIGAVMCLALLAFPVVWVHYGTWLLPVLVLVGSAAARAKPASAGALAGLLGLAALLINFPTPAASTLHRFDHQLWFRLLISHQFFGTLLLYGLCLWCVRLEAARPDEAAASS